MEKEKFLEELRKIETGRKDTTQLYNAISLLAMKYIQVSEKPNRCASYLSIEFLIGRVFYNNLLELGVLQEVSEILKEKGVNIALFRGNRRRGSRQRRLGQARRLLYGFGCCGRYPAVRLRHPL